MGPFEKKVDNGLENRKLAFEFLHSLLQEYNHYIDKTNLMTTCIKGLDDSSIEVQLICQQIISRLVSTEVTLVKSLASTMVSALRKSIFRKTKDTATKQEIEDSQDLIKSSLTLVNLINNLQIVDLEWSALIAEIKKARDEQQSIVGVSLDTYFTRQ